MPEQPWLAGCSDDDYALALTDGAFDKLIQVQLVRKIEGEQFFGVSSSSSFHAGCYTTSIAIHHYNILLQQ